MGAKCERAPVACASSIIVRAIIRCATGERGTIWLPDVCSNRSEKESKVSTFGARQARRDAFKRRRAISRRERLVGVIHRAWPGEQAFNKRACSPRKRSRRRVVLPLPAMPHTSSRRPLISKGPLAVFELQHASRGAVNQANSARSFRRDHSAKRPNLAETPDVT